MINVTCAKCHILAVYAECNYAAYRYAEWHYADCHSTIYRIAVDYTIKVLQS